MPSTPHGGVGNSDVWSNIPDLRKPMNISPATSPATQQAFASTSATQTKAAATDSDGDNDGSTSSGSATASASSATSLPQGSTFSIRA